jgi:sugar lactone lactonase YvrE
MSNSMSTRWQRTAISLLFLAFSTLYSTVAVTGNAFPEKVATLDGASPEGFAIGKGNTAYNGSPDGSIYKVDLRTGLGEVMVPIQDPENCLKLGMRIDPRTNYLFVAGCFHGNAQVFDADSGALLMEYQLDSSGLSIINDLAITRDAVYFTDSAQPFLYRLPLTRKGGLPLDAGAATAIPLIGDFVNGDEPYCCAANGIVATENGKTLIVGHSNASQLYRVDPKTGHADAISVDTPLAGFLDGIVMKGRTLYILTPGQGTPDGIQVVKLDRKMLKGKLQGIITNPDFDGVASGAILGNSLYVNNARYGIFPPQPDTPYWLTKVTLNKKSQKSNKSRKSKKSKKSDKS